MHIKKYLVHALYNKTKTLMKKTTLTFLFTLIFGSVCVAQINTETVKTLDLKRYLGKWYEIARFDHSFEKGIVGATAMYTLKKDGTIKVVNSGFKPDFAGKFKESVGKAKMPDPNEPGKLKVSFFLWFYADYYVLELDEINYSYALIGSKSDKYLWILSRDKDLPKTTIDFLLGKAKERGYDTSKLIWVKHR
jgi:lipocalin